MTPIRVVTATQAADRDARAIAFGTPSRALMQAAGTHAALELMRRAHGRLASGVEVYAGGGNNGGDAWVVAGVLAEKGVAVRVREVESPRTDDALAAKVAAAAPLAHSVALTSEPGIVVDGLLGTGARGAPRGDIAAACAAIDAARRGGAYVVALDVPSRLDAATGAHEGAPRADLTVSFGTVKRGHLLARDWCGAIVVVDIGLGVHADLDDGAPLLADAAYVRSVVPRIAADAHKGARKKVAIIGGARGMAGAVLLAARAALRSGVGLVKLVVHPDNIDLVQRALPEALAAVWPQAEGDAAAIASWADAIVAGPGLGRGDDVRAMVANIARHAPRVVLDADALNAYEGDVASLSTLLGGRSALITPHPAEFARLAGGSVADVNAKRFDAAPEFARRIGTTVLLKGVPTIIAAPDGRTVASASGTPVLGQGGSGDMLAGISATLLGQAGDALTAGAAAAWVHGRAAEIAAPDGAVRGVTLDDVLASLREAWKCAEPTHPSYVLAELSSVGES